LSFTKFLEDQRFMELLLERSALDTTVRRDTTGTHTEAVAAPSVSILHRIVTTLTSALGTSTRAVQQFCKVPVLPYAQIWEADFLVAQVNGRRTSPREEVCPGDTFSLDETGLGDRWLRY
jgi:hypothetical protein